MVKNLKVAQLVLPWIAVPPPGYSGTERVVYYLTEGLVKKGHQVTLFSVGESKTSAQLEYVFDKAMGLQKDVMKILRSSFYPLIHVAHCFEKQDEFDIIHSHAQFLALPFAAVSKTPSVHTFHRIFKFQSNDEEELVMRYRHLNFTSISDNQRIPNVNFVATVYNGIDTSIYKPTENPKKDYLFWAGRVIKKKGAEEAILVAKKLQIPLIIAGKITELEYFENKIKPQINANLITLKEDLSEPEMISLFQNAKATLVPVKWNEPFGLIPVESMACGTPVVAYSRGGVSETVVDGKTGFLVRQGQGVDQLAEKTKAILDMDDEQYTRMSQAAAKHVSSNFSVERMVDDYEKVYREIVDKGKSEIPACRQARRNPKL